ncbi:MAG: serine/threonine protein kinase [Trichodesmium sp.]
MMKQWQEWDKGILIGGKYRILETLGRGNVAITYLASDEKAQKRVVIKTLKPNLLNNLTEREISDLKDKFWKEAINLSKCQNDYIVTFLDARKDPETDLVYIIMEYIDGKSLASYTKIWSQKEALRYIRQIGEALSYIHDQGIIHCNLKPDNIILQKGNANKAVLIGFSLAKTFNHPLTQINRNNADGFTPRELFSKEQPGAFTDIYSLSATLYFLLTKEKPPSVKDRTLASRRDNQSKSDLIEPKEIVKLNYRVNQAIIKGMEIEQEKRPQSVQEWFELLGLRDYLPRPYRDKLQFLLKIIKDLGPLMTIVGILVSIVGIILRISQFSNNPSVLPVPITPENEQHQQK